MKISDAVEELLAEKESEREHNTEYRRLCDLYERLRNEGLVKPPEYNLPQPDTIGRYRHQRTKAV